jgi:maltose O-acetyltransferase
VRFTGPDVTVGRGSFINRDCLFDTSAPITLEERVTVGMGCALITSTHVIQGPEGRAGALQAAPIHIGKGSWLGARVLVLPGVAVGAGCVVAAGAVVTGDLQPHGLYAGVPARRIRDLELAQPVDPSARASQSPPEGRAPQSKSTLPSSETSVHSEKPEISTASMPEEPGSTSLVSRAMPRHSELES